MVTPRLLPRPIPCPAWDRAMLLGHITDSAEVPHDPIRAGRIGIRVAPGDPARSRGCVRPRPAGPARTGRRPAGDRPAARPSDVRPGLFADPVPPRGPACPGDELVAFPGRRPFRGDSGESAWSA
jgi:hypothetical protein